MCKIIYLGWPRCWLRFDVFFLHDLMSYETVYGTILTTTQSHSQLNFNNHTIRIQMKSVKTKIALFYTYNVNLSMFFNQSMTLNIQNHTKITIHYNTITYAIETDTSKVDTKHFRSRKIDIFYLQWMVFVAMVWKVESNSSSSDDVITKIKQWVWVMTLKKFDWQTQSTSKQVWWSFP